MVIITKDAGGQLFKDIDEKQGIVTGYFSKFGNKDSDNDIIQKGSYTKTINESFSRIKHLLDHDKTKVVAKLLVLKEDDFGLYYESKAGNHTLGRDFLMMAQDGLITEHSVGIIPIKQKFDKDSDANIITEVRMFEGSSLQGWGANPYTPIVGVKSEKDILLLFDTIEKALKNGKYSDEAFVLIEEKYKSLKEHFTTAEITVDEVKKDALTSFLLK